MRLIIVSNRLPVSLQRSERGFEITPSAGGLVSGLSAWLKSLGTRESEIDETIWIGWPGGEVEPPAHEEISRLLQENHGSYPVFLSEQEMEDFYFGFCNSTIWPLFHYFPVYARYEESQWQQYQRVNEIFAEKVLEIVRPDDIIWVHDYHLMVLPRMLRERLPNTPIGFFLHIPWPTYEIYRLLPTSWRKGILEGILAADLIGFHTPEYSQYFLRSVFRLLGHEHAMGRITMPSHLALSETFPMGIEYGKWRDQVDAPETQRAQDELRATLGDVKLILSIDRLDYSKGVLKRLQAYARFLEKQPQWHGKVTLLAIVIPSRVGVEKYRDMKRAIDQAIGNINGKYSALNWTPIHYHYRTIPFHQLVAIYNCSCVALVTPLRDGMNLIAKEYVACRSDATGVLILSELAGAAREMTEAIIVNPNDNEEMADAINAALLMPIEEQVRRMIPMQERLQRYDLNTWADEFLRSLKLIKNEQERFYARALSSHDMHRLIHDYRKADRRVLLLDYDGTLMPFAPFPQAARPTPEVLTLLNNLASDERNEVILISGRDKETLERWFGDLRLGLVAEHGVWLRQLGRGWRTFKPVSNQWKPRVLPILQMYADRLPGAFVEEKEYSIAWHYRRADFELATIRSKELRDDLVNLTANIDLHVIQGNRVVEVRVSGINKGAAALHWLNRNTPPFILAIGDDWTDEDMFEVLPQEAYSIRVGMMQSHARFNVRTYVDARELLTRLAEYVEISK